MTNDNSDSNTAIHTPPTYTDMTNNSSPISDPTGHSSAGDNVTADPMAQPLPPAQDAGQNPSAAPDLHTGVATIDLPPTSSTGTGFNAPDAGTGVPDNSGSSGAGASGIAASSSTDNTPLPGVGNIDRDALAGQNKGAGSQANAEAISSTGPV